MSGNGKEERLNYREYNALRGLAAVLSVLPYVGEGLQKRFKDIGEAETFDRLMADVQHLFDAVVRTVPRNKLFGIKTELQHTKLDIRTDFVGCQHNFDNWVCVKEDALVRIAKAAQGGRVRDVHEARERGQGMQVKADA